MRKPCFMYFFLFPLAVILIPAVIAVCFAKAPASVPAQGTVPDFPSENGSHTKIIRVLNSDTGEISSVSLEEYLPGVVAAEMPAEYETEALKAQAVAARSYIMSKAENTSSAHPEADVCSSPGHCKAWLSEADAKDKWAKDKQDFYWKKISEAVKATENEYMIYGDEIVEAFFFAQSGGRTESSADVWGGERPYLKSVKDDADPNSPGSVSEVSVPCMTFWDKLCAFNPHTLRTDGTPVIGETKHTEGGSVATVCIGGQAFRGTDIRSIFGLKSANFTISAASGTVTFTVTGSGHGVGMSQCGANRMAQKGKKYTEILKHYYTNIQIIKN